ncbi:MAG: MFS transporter [Proteobacteria bacterium]|nr:MAG: MFS transporter [Pseudomonadota bacterium]
MAGAIIAPALPGIHAAFINTADAELLTRLLLTTPALAIALSAPVAGYLIDRVGRRPVLLTGLVTYAAAGTSGLYLPSLPWLLGGRLVLGLAVAATMTATTTLIADRYAGPRRARFLACQAAFTGLGGVLFLLAGGGMADHHWRMPFAVYVVSLAVLVAALRTLPEPSRGALIQRDAGDLGVHGETHRRLIAALYAFAFGAMALMFVLPVQLPFMLEERLGASGLSTGLAIGSATFWSALASLSAPSVITRIGRPRTLALTFAPVVVGYLLIGHASTWVEIFAGLLLVGAGLGLLMPNVAMWLSVLAAPQVRGRVLGGLTTATFAGQFISPLLAQPLLSGGRYERLFQVGAGLALALALVALLIGRGADHGVVEEHAPSGGLEVVELPATGRDDEDDHRASGEEQR